MGINGFDSPIKKPNISIFLKIWQIIELVGLLLSLPLLFFAGILFTGDSAHVYHFVTSYIIPSVCLLLIIKSIVTVTLFKSMRWPLYFNLIQNLVLSLLLLGLMVITVLAGAFPVAQVFFLLFFLFISWANLKCLRNFLPKNSQRK